MTEETSSNDFLELATELTIAWLANPNTRIDADAVPTFLQTMYTAVSNLAAPAAAPEDTTAAPQATPAVTVRRSLASKDHIISMIDGKPYKTLKRHLSGHGLTPQEYRERFGLKADYPMVAANYAEMRRGLAKKIGLGRKPGEKVAKSAAKAPAAQAPAAKTPAVKTPAAKTAAAKPKASRTKAVAPTKA